MYDATVQYVYTGFGTGTASNLRKKRKMMEVIFIFSLRRVSLNNVKSLELESCVLTSSVINHNAGASSLRLILDSYVNLILKY